MRSSPITNPELNDSMVYDRSEIIASSRYVEAIERISYQYLLWEDAQNEYRNYQEMYRTAEGLARSIHYQTLCSYGSSNSITTTSNKLQSI
jgi:hypothetical protein